MKQSATMWTEETQLFRRWAAQCNALLLSTFVCGTLYSCLFSIVFILFIDPNFGLSTGGLAGVLFSILMGLLYGTIAGGIAAFTGIGTTFLFAFIEWPLTSKMQPDSFSALCISAAMIPVGYMCALLVGFSVYPSQFWINATFTSPIVFGSVFAVMFSRRFTITTGASQNSFRFDLRAIFVLIGLVAIGLAIDRGSLIIPLLFAICLSVNFIVVLTSRCCAKYAG